MVFRRVVTETGIPVMTLLLIRIRLLWRIGGKISGTVVSVSSVDIRLFLSTGMVLLASKLAAMVARGTVSLLKAWVLTVDLTIVCRLAPGIVEVPLAVRPRVALKMPLNIVRWPTPVY